MPGVAITGLQWGDEGKGKVIDALAAEADIIVRHQGGANAGHTIHVEDEKYVLHIVPAGVLYGGKACVIGNGCVVDLVSFHAELEALEARGIDTEKVYLSERAHLVMPYHRALDEAREASVRADRKIGTTKRGIGPAYADKAARTGLRVVELFNENAFKRRLEFVLREKNAVLEHVYGVKPLEFEPIFESHRKLARELRRRVIDSSSFLQDAVRRDERILYEGAQGVMLDVDHGTYPYVTSSNSSIPGIPAGAGVAPNAVARGIGVLKAYTTRVGEGPFPTELTDEAGETLRRLGQEFGATTGRPRRCGFLDLLQVRYATALCGVRGLALTKLDVLKGIETLRVAVAYEYEGRIMTDFPADLEVLGRVRPVFRDLPGFQEDITEVDSLEDLPENARGFLEFVEAQVGVPVVFLSTGPKRSQFFRRGQAENVWTDDCL